MGFYVNIKIWVELSRLLRRCLRLLCFAPLGLFRGDSKGVGYISLGQRPWRLKGIIKKALKGRNSKPATRNQQQAIIFALSLPGQ